MSTAAVALAVMALTVAACGRDGATTDDLLDELEGKVFLADEVEDPRHRLVEGTGLRLELRDGEVRVHAGCNRLAGRAFVEDGRLVVEDLGGTEMGCDRALMDQDTWVAGLLTSRPAVTLAGSRLTLTGSGTTIVLDEESTVREHRPLEGTDWRLDTVFEGSGDQSSASSLPSGAHAGVRFSDGKVHVETGCNVGNASAEVGEGTITISPLALTRRACPEGFDTVERAVVRTLEGLVSYEIEYDRLTVVAEDRTSGLGFTATGD